MYDHLHYAHRQHHAIVDALESGQAGRVDALMREHAHGVKESLNLVGFQRHRRRPCGDSRLTADQLIRFGGNDDEEGLMAKVDRCCRWRC